MADDFDKYDEPRLHMERLLKAHLVEFDLSLRILFPLEKAGIKTIGQLLQINRTGLLNIPNIGIISDNPGAKHIITSFIYTLHLLLPSNAEIVRIAKSLLGYSERISFAE